MTPLGHCLWFWWLCDNMITVFHCDLVILTANWTPWVWFGLHPWDLEILQTWAQKFVSPLIMLSHNQQNQWKVTCMVHLKSIKVYTPFPQLQFQFLSLIRFYLFQTLLHQLQSSHAFLDFMRANVIIGLTLLTATNVPTSLTAKEVLDELILRWSLPCSSRQANFSNKKRV